MAGETGGHPRPRCDSIAGMRLPDSVLRSTAWCAVLGYALVASGLPLPFGSLPSGPLAGRADPVAPRLLAAKDRTRPFPCMDKPCGCATADQCFTSCCCHPPAERLAWARARGLEATVRSAIERAAAPRPQAASCCSAATGCRAPQAVQAEVARDVGRSRSVSLRAMLACAGIVQQWFAAGSSLPPPRVESPRSLPGPERIAVADVSIDSVVDVPDVPPPRAA